MSLAELPDQIRKSYDIHEWRHASAVLQIDFPNEWCDLLDVLGGVRVHRSHILEAGGGKSKITKGIEAPFNAREWTKKRWETRIIVVEDVCTCCCKTGGTERHFHGQFEATLSDNVTRPLPHEPSPLP